MGEPFPQYILSTFVVLYWGFFAFVIFWVVVRLARSRGRRGSANGSRPQRLERRRSRDDDLWLASYMSELHREQYHDRR